MKKSILKIGAITMLSFFASISMVNAVSYKNYNGIEMTSEELNNLKSLGFTENQIYNMDIDEFESNKDLKGEVVAIDKKYLETTYIYEPVNDINIMSYGADDLKNELDDSSKWRLKSTESKEISEEEFNRKTASNDNVLIVNDQNPHSVSRDYRTLTTRIDKVGNTYRVKNDVSWYTIPKNRSYDLFGISTTAAVAEAVAGSQYAKQSWTIKDSCTQVETNNSETYNKNHSNWRAKSGSYGISFKLPSNTTKTYSWRVGQSYPCKDGYNPPLQGQTTAYLNVTKMESYMYYDLTKHLPGAISAYGSYQHAQKNMTLNASLSFSISRDGEGHLGGVFNLDPGYEEKYDKTPGTFAQILNPSW